MGEQNEKTIDIELRSEKVRNIIGQIPPFLIRSGMGVMAVVIVLALVVSFFIPYYETVEGYIEIVSIPESTIYVSHAYGAVHFETNAEQSTVKQGDTIGYIQSADSVIRLTADISGRLLLNTKQDERIVEGETLYAITPDPVSGVYGRVLLPYEYKTKVLKGQQVRIELAGFPSKKYGTLSGVINEIYPLAIAYSRDLTLPNTDLPNTQPTASKFLKVDIDLYNGLITSNRNELLFAPGMHGIVTVVLSKQRLLLTLF